MPRPLSLDLRERLVEAVNTGLSCNAVAKRFAVAPSSVIKLMQAYRETGSLAPKRMGGHRKAILAPHEEMLKALVAETPDATLAELFGGTAQEENQGEPFGAGGVSGQLAPHLQKNRTRQRARQA